MNKIKGSSSAVKMRYLLFVFAAAVLVSLPTRVYQLLALVDASNGFFKESDVTVPVLYAVVVVFSLLFLVLSFISKEVPSPKLPTGKNPILGISSFIITVGLGWDMFDILRSIIPVNQGNASIFMSLLRTNLAQKGGTFVLLEFVFAFFAIIYFLVFGISHLNGKASYKEFKLLALSPLCWSMTILIGRLMNAISFVRVSELLFEIFTFVFVMLFFLTFARISSGVFTEDSMWGIYGYGLTASLLASVVTIPRIVISFVGLEAVEGYEFNFAHLTVLIFIVSYIFASLGVGFKDGLKNRRTVNELDLPDDFDAIAKKDDLNAFFSEEDEEIVEDEVFNEVEFADNVNDVVFSVEETDFAEVEETTEEIIEPATEEIVEDAAEEILTEASEEVVEETEIEEQVVEEIPEEAPVETEETVEEISEEAVEEAVEAVAEEVTETVEEKSADSGIISLADLKKRKTEE